MEAKEIASILKHLEPDRGNRYAPRSVQQKGEAAHAHWRQTCVAFASKLHPPATHPQEHAAFLTACGCGDVLRDAVRRIHT